MAQKETGGLELAPSSGKREEAAWLVAEDRQSDLEIADRIGVSRSTLARWKNESSFAARVREVIDESTGGLVKRGIVNKQQRLAAYNVLWRKLHAVIDARANDPEYQAQPGGDTGLLALEVKVTTKGDRIETYAVDTALLREIRELGKQAAQESGQWVDKSASLSVSLDATADRLSPEQQEAVRRALTGESG